MKEREERSSAREIIDHLSHVQRAEIDPRDYGICALYSTSIEGITRLITTGKLTESDDNNITLPVVPTVSLVRRLPVSETRKILFSVSNHIRVRKEGVKKARYAARLDCFRSQLKLPEADTKLEEAVMEYLYHIDDANSLKELSPSFSRRIQKRVFQNLTQVLPKNIREDAVVSATIESLQREGIILGIDSSTADFSLHNINGNVSLTLPQQNVKQSIVAIEAVGERERKFLQQMRKL